MKDRLKEHMEGWRFCEKCGMKLYQKIDGCSGTIHLKCHRCNTLPVSYTHLTLPTIA